MPPNAAESLASVLALTIIDGDTLQDGKIVEDTQLLLVVRNPEANLTHPNIISVPTQRIPNELLLGYLRSSSVEHQDDSSATTIFDGEIFNSNVANGHNPLVYAVESLLSR